MLSIIEMTEGLSKGQLFINLGVIQNNENMGSCSYDRTYRLYPYESTLQDEIMLDLNNTIAYGVKSVTLPFKEREDKIPFEQYGYQSINNVESIMIRRVYPKPQVVPII